MGDVRSGHSCEVSHITSDGIADPLERVEALIDEQVPRPLLCRHPNNSDIAASDMLPDCFTRNSDVWRESGAIVTPIILVG